MKNVIKATLALAMLVTAATGQAQDRSSDPLQGIVRCIGDGDFHSESRDRLPASVTTRTVATGRGEMQVSVADGYSMSMHRASKEPLANLKIERSVAGKFDLDRKAIVLQMEALASGGAALARTQQDGIEIVAVDNPGGTETGVRSLITLFDVRSGTIATAYMLNQSQGEREYASDAAYAILRERFVNAVSACMAHSK